MKVKVGDKEYSLTAVSMGNPHVVTYVDSLDFDIETIGKQFEHHEMFPKSVNTEFVEVINDHYLKMRVWERGSGETMACGTGACVPLCMQVISMVIVKKKQQLNCLVVS